MTTEIVKSENPGTLMRQATDVAGVCREIVMKTACNISGKKYVKVEGWQAIATAHGCVLSARDVEKVDGGIRAIAEVRKISDGTVIATAEGFIGEDEPVWFGGMMRGKTYEARPLYARRAMVQTRAMSRVARSAFAHVVVLIDGNLSTTPAEEVPDGGFQDRFEDHDEVKLVTPVPSGEGLRVESVDEKTGEKNGKAWKMFIVKFSDGREATTFSESSGNLAKGFHLDQTPVLPEIVPGYKEGVFELKSLRSGNSPLLPFDGGVQHHPDEIPKSASAFSAIQKFMMDNSIPEPFILGLALKRGWIKEKVSTIGKLPKNVIEKIASDKDWQEKILAAWNADDKGGES